MPPTLFPAPRRLSEAGGAAPAPDAAVVVTHDAALPAQGYRLEYAETIRIAHADAAGLRYAQQSLDQLRGAPAADQRAVVVEDWPDFTRRGFMLDISRDRVPTRAALARFLDLLVLARYNQLELYTEHTFAYRDHAEVWRDASPMTPADLRWLDDMCAARGIELVPNQNTFGHWERWLAHEAYLPRAENTEPVSFAGQMRPPSTLAPTEDNAAFVTGLLEELTGHVRSRRLNIGADETWELGTGASKDRARREGLGAVFLDYVSSVAAPWTARGHTVEFWADILTSYPELMGRIPPGTVPVVWQYDAPSLMREVIANMSDAERRWLEAHGIDVEEIRGFRERSRVLAEAGEPFWVAPGTGTWLSLIGRLGNAVENMLDAAETGTRHGSEGFLLTSWGDHGHYDPPPIAYAPILVGGAVSWGLEANRDVADRLADLLSDLVFADESRLLGKVLVDIGRVADALPPMQNASPLFRALQRVEGLEPHQRPSAEQLGGARRTLDEALADLADARPASADGPSAVAEITQAVRLALFAVDLLDSGVLDPATDPDPALARRLHDRLEALLAGQRRTWLLSARPGGLDDSIARLAPLRRALLDRSRPAHGTGGRA